MFTVGQIIKARLDVAEDLYDGCKGTTVYDNMIAAAKKYRFKIIAEDAATYTLERTDDVAQVTYDRTEIEQMFELDN